MSNWIEEEGRKFFRERTQTETEKAMIAESNYWARIVDQIKSDVQQINEDLNWKHALQDLPLKVEWIEQGVGGLRVTKPKLPAAFLNILHRSGEIAIELQEIRTSDGKPRTIETDKLSVVVQNDLIYLSNDKGVYRIPEDASEHILLHLLRFMREEYVKGV